MPRLGCSLCESPNAREILRRLKAGQTHEDIVLWLASVDEKTHRTTVGRHAKHALPNVDRRTGPRPKGASFLEDVEEQAWEDMNLGVLKPTIRDAISARGELNKQQARKIDQALWYKIGLAMTGNVPQPQIARVLDPAEEAWETERTVLEAEFRALLPSGDESREFAIAEDQRKLAEAQS